MRVVGSYEIAPVICPHTRLSCPSPRGRSGSVLLLGLVIQLLVVAGAVGVDLGGLAAAGLDVTVVVAVVEVADALSVWGKGGGE